MNKVHVDHELLLHALKSTDNYLGVLKDAQKQGGSETHIHDFTQHYTNAHSALAALKAEEKHLPYMKNHVGTMISLAKDEDTSLADEPYAHAPKGGGEADESVNMDDAETISEEEINKIVNRLDWTDIFDLYDQDELDIDTNITEEQLDEKISAMQRVQRRMRFARTATRRDVARMMKLRRASDVKTLQGRAHKAARRALMNRFLRGRDKSQLSAEEKNRIEQQVNRMASVQANLAQRMLPKIRDIEKKRLTRR